MAWTVVDHVSLLFGICFRACEIRVAVIEGMSTCFRRECCAVHGKVGRPCVFLGLRGFCRFRGLHRFRGFSLFAWLSLFAWFSPFLWFALVGVVFAGCAVCVVFAVFRGFRRFSWFAWFSPFSWFA